MTEAEWAGLVDARKRRVLCMVPELDGLGEDVLDALAARMQLQMYPRLGIGSTVGAVRRAVARRLGLLASDPVAKAAVRPEDQDPRWIHAPTQSLESVSLAIVVEGRVRLIQRGPFGRSTERALGPGTLFGEQGVVARTSGLQLHIDAEPVGRAWFMEAAPSAIDALTTRYPQLQARLLRGFEAAKVARDAVDALKAAPELRTVRLDHLYALCEGARIETVTKGQVLPGLDDGALAEQICVVLEGHAVSRAAQEDRAKERRRVGTVIGLTELVQTPRRRSCCRCSARA